MTDNGTLSVDIQSHNPYQFSGESGANIFEEEKKELLQMQFVPPGHITSTDSSHPIQVVEQFDNEE